MGPIARLFRQRNALVLGVALISLTLSACSGSRTARSGCNATGCCVPADPCNPPCEPCAERPPKAKAGETWCKVWNPPVHKLLVERVCVCAAKRKKVYVPPEYGTRPKVVCVQPAKLKEVNRPGVWNTREKEVLACPETECWNRVCCEPDGNPCERQGDCWRKDTVPAKWRKESERVCISPPQTCVQFTPAQYKCVSERILIKEGFCEEYVIPAKFECRERRVCVRPGCWTWVRRPDCDVPEEALPALEVTMADVAADGSAEGVFVVGDLVRYELEVSSDAGSKSMPDLRVVFALPEHLEFVEAGGVDLEGTLDGRTVTTKSFPLAVGETQDLYLVARVVSAPDNTLVQFSASVQLQDGTELATETESTTLTLEAIDTASAETDSGDAASVSAETPPAEAAVAGE